MRRLAPLMLLVLVAGACAQGIERSAETIASLTPSTSPASPTPSAAPSPTPTTSRADTKEPVVVEFPLVDAQIFSPVTVSGTANLPGGVVAVRVLDAEGTELAAVTVDVSCGGGCRGTFSADLAFFVPAEQEGLVEAYEPTPEGAQQHTVQVPVLLVPGV